MCKRFGGVLCEDTSPERCFCLPVNSLLEQDDRDAGRSRGLLPFSTSDASGLTVRVDTSTGTAAGTRFSRGSLGQQLFAPSRACRRSHRAEDSHHRRYLLRLGHTQPHRRPRLSVCPPRTRVSPRTRRRLRIGTCSHSRAMAYQGLILYFCPVTHKTERNVPFPSTQEPSPPFSRLSCTTHQLHQRETC